MLLRVVTLTIILFWLGSIGWLCAVVWAPPGTRMTEVDPIEVYDVFFAWNDQIEMTLLENGERRGQVTIAGGSGDDSETGDFVNELSVSGRFEEFQSSAAAHAANLFWTGVIEFDGEMEMNKADFTIRVPRQQLNATLGLSGKPRRIHAWAMMGEAKLFNYEGAVDGETGALPLHLLPMGSMLGAGGFDFSDLSWESDAEIGTFKFEGRTMRAYLLTMRMPGEGQEVRLFLSEAGEPLKIETDLGFEAVSEILVPLEIYRQRETNGQ